MKQFTDICGYFSDSWATPEPDEPELRSFHDGLVASIEQWEQPLERWPVRNREPRKPIGSQKRAIIHERDGGACRYCGDADCQLVVDHIVPRSAFEVEDLRIADRSDNLQSSCWDCNERRSNFENPRSKRLGVTACCWYCANPEYLGYTDLDLPYDVSVLVYCGRCGGTTHVPEIEGWVL